MCFILPNCDIQVWSETYVGASAGGPAADSVHKAGAAVRLDLWHWVLKYILRKPTITPERFIALLKIV